MLLILAIGEKLTLSSSNTSQSTKTFGATYVEGNAPASQDKHPLICEFEGTTVLTRVTLEEPEDQDN